MNVDLGLGRDVCDLICIYVIRFRGVFIVKERGVLEGL